MKSLAAVLGLGWMVLLATPVTAQEASPESTPAANAAAADADGKKKDDEKPKTIAEVTKDSDRIDGLFTLFRDRQSGELRLLVRADQLDQTFLHFSYAENGVRAAGLFRGNYGDTKVFTIHRYFDRLEFIVANTAYTATPGTPIARAAGSGITHAVVADEKIEAEDAAAGEIVIKAGGLFLRETFARIAPLPDPKRPPHEVFSPGTLSAAKSKVREVRNYPRNTDVIVEYVFENDKPYVGGGEEVADSRVVSAFVQHSLIAAPVETFAARFDDPRIGYFGSRRFDLSATTDAAPYRDPIARWRLVKQDPSAPVSPPVEPIVFWIENTTPVELRPVIERAALLWNEAFLAAGFRDAIVIRTQPDDATWEAGDLRYNVIRWITSPRPVFSGYGPCFFDPRDGRILGADIILEYAAIGNVVNTARALGAPPPPAASPFPFRADQCLAAACAHSDLVFGRAALDALGADTADRQRMLEEFIHYLVIHEIGHTLGLMHNFRSSHLHSLAEVYDAEKTNPVGLTGSIMDYPSVAFAPPGKKQGGFWPARPGPYDIWAITYGYSPALDDPAAEVARLAAILARSTEPALAFGNDADDMRDPGKAIDPRAMLHDLTSDPIGFARDQMIVIETATPAFPQRVVPAGDSYQLLLNATLAAVERYRRCAAVVTRFIGGVHVDRAVAGQPGAAAPFTPVPLADQQRALQLLREKIFAADAFRFLDANATHLLAQRRGFDHFTSTEDPKLHATTLAVQRDVLAHLLHPVVLARLTDTRVYGNGYTVHALLTDLTAAIFADDLHGDVNTRRQQLQHDFVTRLLAIVDPAKDNPQGPISQSAALDRLRWIEQQLAARPEVNAETAAHRAHLLYRIQRGLEGDA